MPCSLHPSPFSSFSFIFLSTSASSRFASSTRCCLASSACSCCGSSMHNSPSSAISVLCARALLYSCKPSLDVQTRVRTSLYGELHSAHTRTHTHTHAHTRTHAHRGTQAHSLFVRTFWPPLAVRRFQVDPESARVASEETEKAKQTPMSDFRIQRSKGTSRAQEQTKIEQTCCFN